MNAAFVRHQMVAPIAPPRAGIWPPAWLRERLFGTLFGTIATFSRCWLPRWSGQPFGSC
jgi:hypothetical protein